MSVSNANVTPSHGSATKGLFSFQNLYTSSASPSKTTEQSRVASFSQSPVKSMGATTSGSHVHGANTAHATQQRLLSNNSAAVQNTTVGLGAQNGAHNLLGTMGSNVVGSHAAARNVNMDKSNRPAAAQHSKQVYSSNMSEVLQGHKQQRSSGGSGSAKDDAEGRASGSRLDKYKREERERASTRATLERNLGVASKIN